jgi:predicted ATP-grasp superfamily ATP-dependent carboligase
MARSLIVAGEYSVGLSRLPKVLSRAGCTVTVLGPPRTLARKSRYTSEFIATGPSHVEIVAGLEAHLKQDRGYDLVLLGDDDALLAMQGRWQEPWVKDWLPFPRSTRSASICTDKLAFGEAMQAAGAPYPFSIRAASLDSVRTAALSIGYPLVLKAGQGSMGVSVRLVANEAGLATAFNELSDNGPLQVQKFISGRVGCSSVLYDRGRLVAFAPSFKSECFPDVTGPSCAREFISHPAMENICRFVGETTGFHGFGGVDWILDSTGDMHVIEFNARPIPGYHFCDVAGVDFSHALRSMLTGEQAPVAQPAGGATVYMFPQHLLRCRYERDWRSLARYLPFCGRMDLPWDDLRLLIEPVTKKLPTWKSRFAIASRDEIYPNKQRTPLQSDR